MSDTIPESSYPPLEKPEFKSQIPAHLLAEASPAERHIISELSTLSQFAQWSIGAHLSTDSQVRRTNGRLIKAETNIETLKEDKKTVLTSWKTIAALVTGAAGLIAFLITVYQAMAGH